MDSDVFPFYVDGGSLEEPQEDHEETTEQDNVGATTTIVYLEHVPMQTPTLD